MNAPPPKKPDLERVQLQMLKDGVATKRIVLVDPGANETTHEGVVYERTIGKAGLHGHPGASEHPYVAIFTPKVTS